MRMASDATALSIDSRMAGVGRHGWTRGPDGECHPRVNLKCDGYYTVRSSREPRGNVRDGGVVVSPEAGAGRALGDAEEVGVCCDRPNGRSISAGRILPTPVVVATVGAETGEIIAGSIICFR